MRVWQFLYIGLAFTIGLRSVWVCVNCNLYTFGAKTVYFLSLFGVGRIRQVPCTSCLVHWWGFHAGEGFIQLLCIVKMFGCTLHKLWFYKSNVRKQRTGLQLLEWKKRKMVTKLPYKIPTDCIENEATKNKFSSKIISTHFKKKIHKTEKIEFKILNKNERVTRNCFCFERIHG